MRSSLPPSSPWTRWAVVAAVATVTLSGCALFRAAQRPADEIAVARTPERVARGAYLANHVAACIECHSPLTSDTRMPVDGKLGAGGRVFGRELGLPGEIVSTNLTPDVETGIGGWSDGEILRAMREGVSKDGRALFALMPYANYHGMSDDDATAIVAYLRSLKPVKQAIPARQLDFPLNLIVNTMPMPLEKAVPPAPSAKDLVARGKYVATTASCADCHSFRGAAGPDPAQYMSGGYAFKEAGEAYWMPNLTSDAERGLGRWTDAEIEAAVRFGQRRDGSRLSPVMPWVYYNKMNAEDMRALIAYLRTVPALPGHPKPAAKP